MKVLRESCDDSAKEYRKMYKRVFFGEPGDILLQYHDPHVSIL